MERQKFEDSWKDAFKDAEASPSENLWTSIELDLEKRDGKALRQRVLFFKLMAAASVVFAMCFGGLYVYQQSSSTDANYRADGNRQANQNQAFEPNENSQTTKPELPTASELGDAKQNYNDADRAGLKSQNSQTSNSSSTTVIHRGVIGFYSSEDRHQIASRQDDEKSSIVHTDKNRDHDNFLLAGTMLPPLVVQQKAGLPFPEKEKDPVALMLARLEKEELKYRTDEQKQMNREEKGEKLWTSVGFAAGSFNTVTSGTPQFAALQSADFSSSVVVSNNVAADQSEASGVSYSAGISLGTKVANRWVIQGGVNYLAQSSSYTTNAMISSPNQNYKAASITELNSLNNSSSTIVNTAPYDVSNSLQYISIPMHAGYLLVNRDFGIQLNAGISTDMFLQNTITPHLDGLDKTTQGNGEDSPYRSVNFSGLVGTEISYRLGQHYRLSVNPGLRYPFSSIYKSELEVEAMPITFDVGMRFRYIFH